MEREEEMQFAREELKADTLELTLTLDRLTAAAAALEQAVERLSDRQSSFAQDAEATIERLVATVDAKREAELEQKLALVEAELAELRASATASTVHALPRGAAGRKTVPVAMVNLLAKQGVTVGSLEAGSLDAALVSLSIEQRIAVKAELMRAGFLGS